MVIVVMKLERVEWMLWLWTLQLGQLHAQSDQLNRTDIQRIVLTYPREEGMLAAKRLLLMAVVFLL